MINKQNLWFLTLFSLILVLSVYYITMPSELLLSNNSNYNTSGTDNTTENVNGEDSPTVTVTESDVLVAMRVSLDEERKALQETLQETLTDTEASKEDKNNAYEQLKYLNEVKGKEEVIQEKIKNTYQLDNFVKIDHNQIKVVLVAKEHNNELANNIMRTVQEEFTDKMYITVKFENG